MIIMGVTKTDFMRGMQCPRMLWLDKHHPEYKVIPPETQRRLDRGNEFGDKAMGLFGPYTEVQEYYPGTKHPDKIRMAKKTLELIDYGVTVICEAAFMDDQGNYCAADILRKTDDGYELYEVKNSPSVTEQHIKDAGFQAFIIKNEIGLNLKSISIIYNSGIVESPYEFKDITREAFACADWIAENIGRLWLIKEQKSEVHCHTGIQCVLPYECWYSDYCHTQEMQMEMPGF